MLSGPSCVGKGPLYEVLKTNYPDLGGSLKKLVLYNSRSPRPGEIDGIDYYFCSQEEMESMARRDRFIVLDVRGDRQGLDLDQLMGALEKGDDLFFEGNPFIPQALWEIEELNNVPMLRLFLSPLSRDEVIWCKQKGVDLKRLVADIQRRKLLRRNAEQKGILSLPDLENIEKRARSAPEEMKLAWQFDWVIPNHDGEDHENWDAFYYPIGDAFRAVHCLAALLKGDHSQYAERWERSLWPE